MSEHMVTVMVREMDTDEDARPSNLAGFIVWLQEALSEIPEEFRPVATIEFTGSGGGDFHDPTASMEISYERPENAAEIKARERRERAQEANRDRERQISAFHSLMRAKDILAEAGRKDLSEAIDGMLEGRPEAIAAALHRTQS